MSNKAYVYDPITREFVGVARLDRDPLGGGFLLPANATYTRPELMDGKAAIYDSKSDKWTQVTDLRGIDVYTIDGGNPYIVEQLGDLPDSVTTTKPEPPAGKLIDRFKVDSGEWLYRDDYTGVVVYNTSNGGAVTLTATDKVISEGYTTKQRPSDAYNWDAKKQDWVLDKTKQAELDKQVLDSADAQLTCLMSQMCAWLTIESYKPKTDQRGGNILSPVKIDEMLQDLPSSVETDLMRNAWSRATRIEFTSATTQSFAQMLGMSKDQLRVAMTEARGL